MQVGADGVLSIESSNTMETVVEVQEGMLIDRGFVSREMVTNQVCWACGSDDDIPDCAPHIDIGAVDGAEHTDLDILGAFDNHQSITFTLRVLLKCALHTSGHSDSALYVGDVA